MNKEALTCDERVVWQDIEFQVPHGWEMLRWGLQYERGLCVFWDRADERLQLSWQRDAACPDFERLLSDLRAQEAAAHAADPEQHPAAEWLPLPAVSSWHGCVMCQDGELTTRAACYVPELRTLVEVGICWGSDRVPELESELLSRIRVRSPRALRTWRALGLHAEVPSDLRLAACHCLPGGVSWRFQDRRGRRTAAMERLAFPSTRITTTLRDWLAKQLPPRYKPVRRLAAPKRGSHAIEVIESRCLPSLSPLAWRIRHMDAATLCPRESRLYHWSAQSCSGPVPEIALECLCGENRIISKKSG
ncbi:MAG: hypothetical protein HQ559_17280 [Lentisphaerae bacterium]|nr:hypothetical protein [Lentisphaerota bacterium]